ncbi:MAG: hypothetical protein JWQ19_2994, partial [Subtercola sp.]|nr:hypothetical protein [Subtercola sp.]
IDLAFALAAIGCAVVCAALTTHALTIRRRVALA